MVMWGKCLKLTTVSTGFLGAMFGAPIAAGNLFTGDFQIDMGNPAKSNSLWSSILQDA